MGRPVFLGKSHIHWCEKCNVPLIDDSCAVHGKENVFRLDLTPPGDLRFAFERDIELIRSVFLEHFGVDVGEVFEGKIVLLNKLPGEDEAYEVIVDGYVFGYVKFDPIELKWRAGLKVEGAMALWKRFGKTMRKWVIVDRGAVEPIKGGANLLPVGVLEADPSIMVNDEVILVSEEGEVFATGIAKKDYGALIRGERGTGVKPKRQKKVSYREGRRATMEDVLRANSIALEEKVTEAREFMRRVSEKYSDLPVAVAFSGGKDSLAVLGLALEEFGGDFTVFFNNTGIEFPETIEYVEKLRKDLELKGIKFIVADAGDAFWRALYVFSPPGRDYRWCCKVTKLGPITLAIKENYPKGVLMFVGQRKYESIKRFKQPRVWRNEWVPNEIGASPVFHWRAIEVWLYIFSRKLPYNPLYERGFDRIGCFLCPSASLSEFERLKKEKPELWEKWFRALDYWRRRFDLPEEWITHGFWRWKKLSRGEKAVAQKLGVEIPEERSWEPVRYSIEETDDGVFTVRFNTVVNLDRIREVAPILGEVEAGENYIRAGDVIFREDGAYTGDFNEGVQAYYLVKRAYECVGCGVCVGKCPEGALSIDPRSRKIVVNYDLCTHCRECMDVCPLLKIKNPEEGSQL